MLIQIVPSLLPQTDGIGDYALRLAKRLRERHGILTTFLAADPTWEDAGLLDGFRGFAIREHTSTGFSQALEQCRSQPGEPLTILTQFSPYGYEKRGVPFWFVTACEQYLERNAASMNVCFHELERTDAPVWSSGFWVPSLQRRLLLRMAHLSRHRYTNTEGHRSRLERWGSGRTALMPNFSTMVEPEAVQALARRNDLVVFSRPGHRRLTYLRGGRALAALCRRLNIERIIDIGSPIDGFDVQDIAGVPIMRCGRLPEEEITRWMATSLGTFLWYPVEYLTKSSVHAIACSYGAISFVYDDGPRKVSCPGLETGIDFVPVTEDGAMEIPALDGLHEAIYQSYRKRASWTAADTLARDLFGREIRSRR